MPNLSFSEGAWEDYLYWQNQDRKILKHINTLLKEINRMPYDGIGKPEALRNDLSGLWSRRIDRSNRLIYRVCDDCIEVIACKGYYK